MRLLSKRRRNSTYLYMIKRSLKFQMHSRWVQYNLKRNMSMKAYGRIIKETEEVSNNGEMGLFMKDIGKIMLPMATEDSFMQTEMFI